MTKIDFAQMVTEDAKKAETLKLLRGTFERATQSRLDAAAQLHGYDNIMTAVSYADEPSVVRFQRDGQAFRTWRSQVWQYAYQALSDVESGVRATPTLDDFLAELPALEVPDAG